MRVVFTRAAVCALTAASFVAACLSLYALIRFGWTR